MEKVKVSYANSVQLYFNELIEVLFYKDYFIYEENAILYVQKIVVYIEDNIANLPHRKTPKSLSKHGDFYIFYKPNNKTTWYIFFSKKENNYLIKHITNSHHFDSKVLNDNK